MLHSSIFLQAEDRVKPSKDASDNEKDQYYSLVPRPCSSYLKCRISSNRPCPLINAAQFHRKVK